MKVIYKIIPFFIIFIMIIYSFQVSLNGQNIKPTNAIQGKWKCIKIKSIFDNRNLTTAELEGENLIKKWNVGKIYEISGEKFYIYEKNGKIEDSTLYKLNGDTLIFLDKKYEYFNKEMAFQIYKIKGNILTIDMHPLDNKNEFIHCIYKRLKLKSK